MSNSKKQISFEQMINDVVNSESKSNISTSTKNELIRDFMSNVRDLWISMYDENNTVKFDMERDEWEENVNEKIKSLSYEIREMVSI